MSPLSSILRANEGLIVALALCLAMPAVLAVVGLIMRLSGASLRPIVFLAVLFTLVLVPFSIGQLVLARKPPASPALNNDSGVSSPPSPGLPIQDGKFAEPEKLFGPPGEVLRVQDAKAIFPGILDSAEHAEWAVVGTGESVLVAQFPQSGQAKQAATIFWRTFQLKSTSGDEERGWRGQRGAGGDYIEMWRTGRHLFIWTALTRDALTKRRAVTTVSVSSTESDGSLPRFQREPLLPALQPLGELFRPVPVKAAGLILLLCIYAGWFFKGAAWAGSTPARANVQPLMTAELAARLESINTLDVPFRIERGDRENEFFATWRYADAKWIDLARAHGLRRVHRIKMTLDPESHVVRATDYAAAHDWSAGKGGARLEWKTGMGIVFFHAEHQRVFGLQLDEHGRFKPELSYSYKFNLDEMKSPLIEAVIGAGWTWRPTVWQGPEWLRWLTE